MKKGLLILTTLFAANFLFGQAQRTILVEEFTQASCPPCATQNPAFNALLDANAGKVVSIKYQTWWPGYDPMFEQNKEDVEIRVPYYGVNGVPHAVEDGITVPNDCAFYEGAPACYTQDKIDLQSAKPSPIELSVSHVISADLSEITITLTVNNVSGALFGGPGNVVQLALVENEINFPAPPGTNGELDFYGVMRKMIPDANGTEMPIALPPGFPFTQSITVPLPNWFYNFNEVAVVAFVQNVGSKEVFQAAFSAPQALVGYPDLSWERTSVGPANYCDYNITPGIIITNNDALEVTSFDVDVIVDGTVNQTVSFSGNLAQNASKTMAFAGIALPGAGKYTLDYTVKNINGSLADYNTLNNQPEPATYTVLPLTTFGEKIEEDMESVTPPGFPEHTVFEGVLGHDMQVVDKDYFVGVLQTPPTLPVGAFALSDKALWVNFYDMQPGKITSLIWEKIDLSNAATNSKIFFDRAYRQFGAENDRLQIQASKDCGDTWTNLFNKAGSALKTLAASQAFFVPQTAAQWKKDSASLGAFVGEPEVLIRFRATSAYGNNLWLDNINIVTNTVGTIDPTLDAATSITPNPTTDNIMVELNLPEAMNLTISITDVAGKTIGSIAETQAFAAGKHQLNFNEFAAAGIYFVNIRSENGQTTKRLTVIK